MESHSAETVSRIRFAAWLRWNPSVAVAIAFLIGFSYMKWIEPLDVTVVQTDSQVADPEIPGRALIDDEIQYLQIAKRVADGVGYQREPGGKPTAVRVPGYPLYVAALFKAFGPGVTVALFGNALLISLLPALAFALAKPVFGYKTAVVASYFCAFNPGLYYLGLSRAYSEPLFAVLLCCGTAMWQRKDRSRRPANAFAAGALYGAASLTRTGYFGLPVLLTLAEAGWPKRKWRWRNAIALGLAFLLVISMWGFRNWIVMGTPMLSSTNDGVTLLGTVLAAERGRGDWLNPEDVAPRYAEIQRLPNEIESSRTAMQTALGELRHISPTTLFKVAAKRLLRFWIPLNRIVSDELSLKANIAANLLYFPLIPLAAVGLWRARHSASIIPLLSPCLYATLLAAISWGGTRFRYGLEPILAVFGAYGLVQIAQRFGIFSGPHFATAARDEDGIAVRRPTGVDILDRPA